MIAINHALINEEQSNSFHSRNKLTSKHTLAC